MFSLLAKNGPDKEQNLIRAKFTPFGKQLFSLSFELFFRQTSRMSFEAGYLFEFLIKVMSSSAIVLLEMVGNDKQLSSTDSAKNHPNFPLWYSSFRIRSGRRRSENFFRKLAAILTEKWTEAVK